MVSWFIMEAPPMSQSPSSRPVLAPVSSWSRLSADAAHRLLAALFVAMLTAFAVEGRAAVEITALLVWNAGAWTYILLALSMIVQSDVASTREHARQQDASDRAILLLLMAANFCAVLALALLIDRFEGHGRLDMVWHLVLALLALMASWGLMQVVFCLHYARLYYEPNNQDGELGGLEFPGRQQPDFLDFLYHATGVAMSFAGSGASPISRRMRSAVLVHGVVAFAFNMGVLSLSVNLMAAYF